MITAHDVSNVARALRAVVSQTLGRALGMTALDAFVLAMNLKQAAALSAARHERWIGLHLARPYKLFVSLVAFGQQI